MTGGGTTAGAGAIRFLRWHPWGLAIDSNAASTATPERRTAATWLHHRQPDEPHDVESAGRRLGGHRRRSTRRSDSYPAAAPYTLTAPILGASVSPNPDVIASATHRRPDRSVVHADEPVRRVHRAAQSARRWAARSRHADRSRTSRCRSTTVTVPAGATSLRATIGSPSDPAADLDLFVYNCTTGTCVLAGQSADGDSEESVTIANPAAGHLEGRSSTGSTSRRGRRRTTTSTCSSRRRRSGSVAVTDANALRPAGALVDGARHGDGERRAGRGTRPVRQRPGADGRATCSSAPAT